VYVWWSCDEDEWNIFVETKAEELKSTLAV